MTKLRPDIKAQWLQALRSGDYEKGFNVLKAVTRDSLDGSVSVEYCCLGVLCDLAVKAGVAEWKSPAETWQVSQTCISLDENGRPSGSSASALPNRVAHWAFERPDDRHPNNPTVTVMGSATALAVLNDGEEGWRPHSFEEIATLIEEQM